MPDVGEAAAAIDVKPREMLQILLERVAQPEIKTLEAHHARCKICASKEACREAAQLFA